jgi:hypothetical protein
VRLFLSEDFVEPEIMINEMNVKKSPSTIYMIVFVGSSSNGLQAVFGFEARADH